MIIHADTKKTQDFHVWKHLTRMWYTMSVLHLVHNSNCKEKNWSYKLQQKNYLSMGVQCIACVITSKNVAECDVFSTMSKSCWTCPLAIHSIALLSKETMLFYYLYESRQSIWHNTLVCTTPMSNKDCHISINPRHAVITPQN